MPHEESCHPCIPFLCKAFETVLTAACSGFVVGAMNPLHSIKTAKIQDAYLHNPKLCIYVALLAGGGDGLQAS